MMSMTKRCNSKCVLTRKNVPKSRNLPIQSDLEPQKPKKNTMTTRFRAASIPQTVDFLRVVFLRNPAANQSQILDL